MTANRGKPINEGIESGKSFEDRVGAPDSVTSALGHVVLAFSSLELAVSRAIVRMLATDEEIGVTVAAELPFGNKIHLLGALGCAKPRELHESTRDSRDVLAELIAECFRAEELRNRLMHSFWEGVTFQPERMVRFKRSAKAKRGLHTDIEHLDSGAILDVADYIDRAAGGIDVFFGPPIERFDAV